MQTKEHQKDFLDLLRNGYVISANHIIAIFNVRNVDKFVQGIRDRTELDIYEGRRFSFEDGADEKVYYMVSDIKPECPGLDNMGEPIVPTESTVSLQSVYYQNGYYLMWDCPNIVGNTLCGQFHKVDLGDTEFTKPLVTRCIKCGKQYQIRGQL